MARFGGELGHPTTDNATAIFYNPAGIALSEGGHVYGDLSLAWRRSRYVRSADPRDAPVPPGGQGANTGTGKLFNVLVTSPFVGATYKLDKLALGLAYYVPYGGQSQWQQNDAFKNNSRYPGAVDGVQRWYSIDGVIKSSYISGAAAYDFGPVDIGIGLNLVQTVVNTVRAKTPNGSDNLLNEGRSWLDATGYDFSFGAGIIYEAIPRQLWLGLSYQSAPNFWQGVKASGNLKVAFANGQISNSKRDFHTDLPDVIRLGGKYRPRPDIELRLFGDYQRWSVLKNQCVSGPGKECRVLANGAPVDSPNVDVDQNQVRDWNDTFGVRAGGSYFPTDRVEVIAGAGFASNAIPDKTLEPALQDYDAFTAALGGRFELAKTLHLATTYTQVFYLSRDTTGKSIHPDLTGAAGVTSPSRGPASGGKYSQQVGLLNVNLDFSF